MREFGRLLLVAFMWIEVSSIDLTGNSVLNKIRDSIESYRWQTEATQRNIKSVFSSQKQIINEIGTLNVFGNQCSYSSQCPLIKFESFSKEINSNISLIEIPLAERMIELSERILEVKSLTDIYYQQFNSILQRCKKDDLVCAIKVQNEFESSLKIVSCRIESNCSIHSISKRSPSLVHGSLRNCEDGSYGRECPKKEQIFTPENCSLEYGHFLCDRNKCVTVSALCDGKDDCGDGSDEGGHCGELNCVPGCYLAGGVCLGTPRGATCLSYCPPGSTPTLGGGCLPGTDPGQVSLEELLEEVPELLMRYYSAARAIRTHFFRLMTRKGYENNGDGRGAQYSLGKLLGLDRYNKVVSNISSTTARTETFVDSSTPA